MPMILTWVVCFWQVVVGGRNRQNYSSLYREETRRFQRITYSSDYHPHGAWGMGEAEYNVCLPLPAGWLPPYDGIKQAAAPQICVSNCINCINITTIWSTHTRLYNAIWSYKLVTQYSYSTQVQYWNASCDRQADRQTQTNEQTDRQTYGHVAVQFP